MERGEWAAFAVRKRLCAIGLITRTDDRHTRRPLTADCVKNHPRARDTRGEALQWFVEDSIDIGTVRGVKKHINWVTLKEARNECRVAHGSPLDSGAIQEMLK